MYETGVAPGDGYAIEPEINGKKINLEDLSVNDIELIIEYAEKIFKENISMLKSEKKQVLNKKMYIEICEKIICDNNNIKTDVLPNLSNKSDQYISLIKKIYSDLYYCIEQNNYDDYKIFEENIKYCMDSILSIFGKIDNLSKFEIFADLKDQGILMIGSNGSGKSSFISFLKSIYDAEMILIPAQKILIYDETIQGLLTKNKEDIKQIQHENLVEMLRSPYMNINLGYIASSFSTLLTVIANETIKEQNDYIEKRRKLKQEGKITELQNLDEPVTILDKINIIWSMIIKDKRFYINTEKHCIEPGDMYDNRYGINSLSDGKKIILYYIGNVLLSVENSYIVVDEPETYLNPSVYKQLWDVLEDERKDCQFIYISHDIDFIRSRRNMKIVWMKEYNHPNNWNMKLIEDNDLLPNELLIQIYGSKNKIIFCEGTKDSLDYDVYSAIFGNDYSVIPVGSCIQVCQYTRAFNASTLFHNSEAIGIIDFDNRTSVEIEKLKAEKIYVTDYNEIEMLLFDETIIREVIKLYGKEEVDKKISKYKEKFLDIIKKEKEKMAFQFVREKINTHIKNYRIRCKNISQIEEEINTIIKDIDFNKEYNEYLEKLECKLRERNYDELLKFCNLKKAISSGLCNDLISDFEKQAVGAIRMKLNTYIKEKYFKNI